MIRTHYIKNKKIILIALFILVWAFFIEPQILTVKEYNIKLPELAGEKAVAAGDFHFRNISMVNRVVKKINAQNPDYVFYLGDYTETVPIEIVSKALLSIKSKHGIFTVAGNHDEDLPKEFNILNNRSVKAGKLTVAGVEDYWFGHPDVNKSLEKTTLPVILLTHNPDVFQYVPDSVALTLAGHTHGGQITLFSRPFYVPAKHKYSQGMIKEHERIMIVTKGIGTAIIPARLFSLPEIVVFNFTE